jgi:hypothetical protein
MSSRRSSEGAPKKFQNYQGKVTSQNNLVNDHSYDDDNLVVQDTVNKIPHILPHERVFPIQIGGELFKLSGASLSSDGWLSFTPYLGVRRLWRHQSLARLLTRHAQRLHTSPSTSFARSRRQKIAARTSVLTSGPSTSTATR